MSGAEPDDLPLCKKDMGSKGKKWDEASPHTLLSPLQISLGLPGDFDSIGET
jgi:hypothetical protein